MPAELYSFVHMPEVVNKMFFWVPNVTQPDKICFSSGSHLLTSPQIWQNQNMQFQTQIPLAPKTTLKIGGPAQFFFAAKSPADLITALQQAKSENLPVTILGGCSNVLISDAGIKGLVLQNLTSKITSLSDSKFQITSGTPLSQLLSKIVPQNFDLSFLSAIPGTLGGAVRGNAGAWGGQIGDHLISAQLFDLDSGEILEKSHDWFQFSNRHSNLKNHPNLILLEATFKFPEKPASEVQTQIQANLQTRSKTQPKGLSVGSVFKNPPNNSAGKLIDEAGLKGTKIGDIQISPLHANFFINLGNGTASDFLTLVKKTIQAVQAKSDITLEPEFQPLGFSDSELAFLKS